MSNNSAAFTNVITITGKNIACAQIDSNPIPGDSGSYSYTFSSLFNESTGTYPVEVTAVVEDTDNTEISATATAIVEIINTDFDLQMSSHRNTILEFIDPDKFKLLLPLIGFTTYPPGEPNNKPCIAHYIDTNTTLSTFIPDDTNDWYIFDIPKNSSTEIRLTEFTPFYGQVSVWAPDNYLYF